MIVSWKLPWISELLNSIPRIRHGVDFKDVQFVVDLHEAKGG